MFIITSKKKKKLNRLGDIIVYICSGVETMADFTAHSGQVCDKTPVSVNSCGTSLCPESVNSLF